MEEDGGLKFCLNCKRDIPNGNFIMHTMHCQRNLALCSKCDEPVPLVELASHNATFHASIDCPACGTKLEQMELADHQRLSCHRRVICCNYCHIETEADELLEHENYCGSRTEKCAECGEFVMLKYKQLHEDSNHGFLKLDDEPGPTPSWNKPSRTTSSLSNDLSRQRKVLNTTQDRPVAPSNRLSPSKRTNDMPQVNSTAAVSLSKALHKHTIQKEDNASRLPDPEASPYALANNLMENLVMTNDMVALPCEFCEAMIPSDQLVVHETGCRPDLACYKKPGIDEPGLPCEFCGGLYSPYKLLAHQALCEIPTRDQVPVNQLGLPAREGSLVKQLNKPIANVNPIQPGPGLPAATSQLMRPASTGAVPKQKAGNNPLGTLREINKEVPRTPPSTMSQNRTRKADQEW